MALISIVVPVYFNARSLSMLQERLNAIAEDNARHDFEFIYVDDGSGDDSYSVLQTIAAGDARVRVIKLVRNFGSNTAILAGLTYARGDCAGFIAADLQDPPEKLTEMIACWENGYKVVLAVRADRQGDPFFTCLFAGVFNWLFSKLIFSSFSPQGVGFFLVDQQVVQTLVNCQEKNAHLIGLIMWAGYRYAVVDYDRVEREHGKSHWTFRKKFKYFIDAFTAFSYLPLRLASTMGLIIAGLGALYALIVVAIKLLGEVPVPGWSGLMVVVLLTSGVQLVMLGIIGEYLWRNFDATRQRPLFIVDSVVGGQGQPVMPAPLPCQGMASVRPLAHGRSVVSDGYSDTTAQEHRGR